MSQYGVGILAFVAALSLFVGQALSLCGSWLAFEGHLVEVAQSLSVPTLCAA